MLSNIITTSNK